MPPQEKVSVIALLENSGHRCTEKPLENSYLAGAFDKRKDLAIIKIAGFDLPSIELANSRRSGVAYWQPQGLQGSVTTGVVFVNFQKASGSSKLMPPPIPGTVAGRC